MTITDEQCTVPSLLYQTSHAFRFKDTVVNCMVQMLSEDGELIERKKKSEWRESEKIIRHSSHLFIFNILFLCFSQIQLSIINICTYLPFVNSRAFSLFLSFLHIPTDNIFFLDLWIDDDCCIVRMLSHSCIMGTRATSSLFDNRSKSEAVFETLSILDSI